MRSREEDNYIHRVGVIGAGTSPIDRQLTAVYRLTDEEYVAYKSAVTELRAWVTSDAHSLIGYSLQSLQATIDKCAALFRDTPRPSSPQGIKLAINAAFLNLLSHARLYLDHTETMIKHASHSTKEDDLAKFKEITGTEYDNVFAYRFCYKLRNYAMHCGFPISGFSAHSGFIDGTEQVEHSFEVTFSTKELLSNFDKWGAKVKSDLKSMPEQLDMLKIANEYVQALERVQEKMLKVYSSRLLKAAKTIKSVAAHAKKVDGYPHIISMPPEDEIPKPVTKLNVEIERIPLELVELAKSIKVN